MSEYQLERIDEIIAQFKADGTITNRDFNFMLQSLRDAWGCLKSAESAIRAALAWAAIMESKKQ
jgi:hypothetical protein